MMRLLRLLVVLVFIIGCAMGGYTKYQSMQTIENSSPVITIEEDTLRVSCSATREDLLQGVTASDAEDGDLTSEIIIENASNFIEPGRCRIYYAVFDSAGKVAAASRTLIYEDYTSPAISLTEPLTFTAGSTVSVLDKIRVEDCIDGDISSSAEVMSSTVKSTVSGVYRVKIRVSNSHGDMVTLELPVVISDAKDQDLVLTLDTPVLRLHTGDSFNADSHLTGAKDASGNTVSLYRTKTEEHNANVNVSGSVSTDTPGVYYITYTVIDDNAHRGTAVLTVIVDGEEEIPG